MKQNGNVLFLILIAVALFAALSYAVTQSTRGGGNADEETSELVVSEILNHFSAVKFAVDRLLISGQCTEKEVRFWHASRISTGVGHYGDNSNPSCEIFDPSGGGASYQTPPDQVQSIGGTEYMVLTQGIVGMGTDTTSNDPDGQGTSIDLVITTLVTRGMCLSVNDREGITNPSGEPPHNVNVTDWYLPPSVNFITMPSWTTGGYMSGGLPYWGWGVGETPEIAGKNTGCISYEDSSGATYYILYSVLIER